MPTPFRTHWTAVMGHLVAMLFPAAAVVGVVYRHDPSLIAWIAPCLIGVLAILFPLAMLLPLADVDRAKPRLDNLIHQMGLLWLSMCLLYLFGGSDPTPVWMLASALVVYSISVSVILVRRNGRVHTGIRPFEQQPSVSQPPQATPANLSIPGSESSHPPSQPNLPS